MKHASLLTLLSVLWASRWWFTRSVWHKLCDQRVRSSVCWLLFLGGLVHGWILEVWMLVYTGWKPLKQQSVLLSLVDTHQCVEPPPALCSFSLVTKPKLTRVQHNLTHLAGLPLIIFTIITSHWSGWNWITGLPWSLLSDVFFLPGRCKTPTASESKVKLWIMVRYNFFKMFRSSLNI